MFSSWITVFRRAACLNELIARRIHSVIRLTASGTRDFSEVKRFLAGPSPDAEADFS